MERKHEPGPRLAGPTDWSDSSRRVVAVEEVTVIEEVVADKGSIGAGSDFAASLLGGERIRRLLRLRAARTAKAGYMGDHALHPRGAAKPEERVFLVFFLMNARAPRSGRRPGTLFLPEPFPLIHLDVTEMRRRIHMLRLPSEPKCVGGWRRSWFSMASLAHPPSG